MFKTFEGFSLFKCGTLHTKGTLSSLLSDEAVEA